VSRQRFRFRAYEIRPDPLAVTTLEAECVSGAEAECGASSGDLGTPPALRQWVADRASRTGHQRFRLITADYALAEPGEWL
jgi:hypothetical protein